MARHRNVRTMNYEDEYYDDDDYLGHSVEDNYCISPGTAAQFTFNREKDFSLSTYMEEKIPEEDEDSESENQPLNDSQGYKPNLNDTEQAKLNSCLEEIHNVLGESFPEHILCQTVINNKFNLQACLNELLSAEAPKPQQQPKQNRRNRSEGDDNDEDDFDNFMESLESESPDKTHFLSSPNMNLGILKLGKLSPSVESIHSRIKPNAKDSLKEISPVESDSGGSESKGVSTRLPTTATLVDVNSNVKNTQSKNEKIHPKVGGLSLASLAKQHGSGAGGLSLSSLAKSGSNVQHVADGPLGKQSRIEGTHTTDAKSLPLGVSKSGPKKSAGISLTDLIKQANQDKDKGVAKDTRVTQSSKISLADLSGQRSKVDVRNSGKTNMSISLSDLASKMPAEKSATDSIRATSLADLASKHKPSTGQTEKATTNTKAPTAATLTGQIGGLSLSDLAKKHQSQPQKLLSQPSMSLRDLANQQNKMVSDKQAKTLKSKREISSPGSEPPLLVCKPNTEIIEKTLSDKFSESVAITSNLTIFLEDENEENDNLKMVLPSVLAKTVSSQVYCPKCPVPKKRLRYPNFSYKLQMCNVVESLPIANVNIVPFDFSTPSPDDMVIKKQSEAFTRSGR